MKEETSWGITGVLVSLPLTCNIISADICAGQVGRALGPLIFCTLYWWAGRETAYAMGAAGMVAVCGLVFGGLKVPPGTENVKKIKQVIE
jgi:hypothetical protein